MMQLVAMALALSSSNALARMRSYKRRFDLSDHCQVHHIIPRQAFQTHRHKLADVPVEGRSNLMLMPSTHRRPFFTRRNVHDGGHMRYNEHVIRRVSACGSVEDITELQRELRQQLRGGDPSLPWK